MVTTNNIHNIDKITKSKWKNALDAAVRCSPPGLV